MQTIGFQEVLPWMGASVLTLADVWPEPTRAMIVGLNPAPKSVAAGHYYQGAVGRRQLLRLADAGLFQRPSDRYFENEAIAAGVGFTDLVKRPTTGEADVPGHEQAHGRDALVSELASRAVPLVVCVFRHPADAILDGKSVVGFQVHTTPWGGALFRMPGPFENAARSDAVMTTLREYISAR
ncbi:uracil-DNA glycosylase family protein [Microbacterium sp. LMI12-1-1.1]|uniref:uracil-DNA glycosylase family protein n=1 Tax=Microbacterium sp. LMI12-1-1.1 TaxID=3135225 RepID=UPI0034308609